MSFNLSENTTYINVKLTDAGRRQLSLGRLNFKKAVLSDREVNYGIDRTGYYDILNNKVLSPVDFHPSIDPFNLDGTNAVDLSASNVVSAKQFYTADTTSAGFFSGSPNTWTLESSKYKAKGVTKYASNAGLNTPTNTVVFTGYAPQVGDLALITWVPPQYGTTQPYMGYDNIIPSGSPANSLFYRIYSAISSTDYIVDRPLPRYTTGVAVSAATFFYAYDAIENYYSSASTQSVKVWNLNIVRTRTLAGTDDSSTNVTGYTRYSSLEYNGAKQFFGFKDETPAVGFIHYTNRSTGNTYGEQFIEKSVQIYIPMIMWHNISENNGAATRWGASFFDLYGTSVYDPIAQTTYRELRDGISSSSLVVGRVYHKLRLIVITDQELLNALSYKSDRNYTLPDFTVNLTSLPKLPLTVSQATGLCRKDYTYFVSYITESDPYDSTDSFGHPDGIHCGYIKKIDGDVDVNGNPQYLQMTFNSNGFPYMRSGNLSTSGHGWNANYVQMIVSEQLTSDGYDIGSVPPTSWKKLSSKTSGGNGIYRAVDVGDATVDPLKLNGNTFIVSSQDYISGTTYVIQSGITTLQETLNFGGESFFHGVVDLQIFATTYKTIITVYATNTQVNLSTNETFDSALDTNTYISEISILNEDNLVVAVGKPTSPLRKNNGRFLAFQLEINY